MCYPFPVTTLSLLPMEQFSAGVTRYTRLRGKNPDSLRDGYSAPLLLRFAIDDLNAYALEAAAAGLPSQPPWCRAVSSLRQFARRTLLARHPL
jgi:hypothetical protein